MITTIHTATIVEGKTYIVRKTLVFGIPVKVTKMEVPKNGDLIRITWLPNPRNHKHVQNAYIGSVGVVEGLEPDGSFYLRMTSATLIVGTQYKFKKL